MTFFALALGNGLVALAGALALGNRTLLMQQGKIIHDINSDARRLLKPEDLLEHF